MPVSATSKALKKVALHPEGVDRNTRYSRGRQFWAMSPSTRRAWIEITSAFCEQR